MSSSSFASEGGLRSRPEAQAIAWSWRGRDARVAAASAAHTAELRRKGLIQGAIGLTIAAAFFYFDHTTLAVVAGSIATLMALLAVVSPTGAFAAVERLMLRLGRAVGVAVTWLVMLPIFGLFFVPFGVLFRRGAKDPMRRGYDAAAPSYWKKREDPLGGDRHRSQF